VSRRETLLRFTPLLVAITGARECSTPGRALAASKGAAHGMASIARRSCILRPAGTSLR